MRRPFPHAGAALVLVLVLLAATGAIAMPAGAQAPRTLRRAFEPAVTPLFGLARFGERTTEVASGATRYEFANGVAFGLQGERPLTRRTALMGTATVAPFSRVNATSGDAVGELEKALVVGADLGVAARLKPAAPLFVYAGGGGVLSTRRAAGETSGTAFDPRVSGGLGIDVMRFERTGFRFLYLVHMIFPGTPDAARWEAKSSTLDHTIVVGGRYTLGWGRDSQ